MQNKSDKNLEVEYGEAFSEYYRKFLSDTYNEWGKEKHLPSIARFKIIVESEYSDFDRAIELTKNNRLGADIASWLGLIFYNLGILSKALGYHRLSLGISEELNDRVWMAGDYTNIGLVLDDMGKYQEALDNHNKALKIHEELNDRAGMANDYMNIGALLDDMGKLQDALENHNKALKIHEELNDRVGMGRDHMNIGSVLGSMGINHHQEALESLNKALKIHEELNDGNVLYYFKNYQQALESYNKALKIHEELNDRVWMAKDYWGIANVLGYMREYPKALDSFNKALKIYEEINVRMWMPNIYYNMSFVLSEDALKSLYKALTIIQEIERENGYRHPLTEEVNNRISYLKG